MHFKARLTFFPFLVCNIFVVSGTYSGYILNQVIQNEMKMTYFMEGSVNGHDFTIEGEGSGKPYE